MLRTPNPNFWIFLLLLLATTAHTQLRIGAGAGGQSSYYLIDQIPSEVGEATSGALLGYQAMLVGKYDFNTRFSLRSGLSYQRHRINWGIMPLWTGKEQVYTMSYISLPLSVQFTPTERWHVIAGMEAGCLLMPPSKAEQWERFDYGILVGAGFAILPQLHLNFEHFVGLPRVGEGRFLDEESNISGVYYFRNRSVRVSCVYYFYEFDKD